MFLSVIVADQLSVMCSGKKHARQFDFMTMFEETRKTAMERSQPVLGNYFIIYCWNWFVVTVMFLSGLFNHC